jgi:hypothetical protein
VGADALKHLNDLFRYHPQHPRTPNGLGEPPSQTPSSRFISTWNLNSARLRPPIRQPRDSLDIIVSYEWAEVESTRTTTTRVVGYPGQPRFTAIY